MKQLVVDSMQTYLMESFHIGEKINLKELPVDTTNRTKTEATAPVGPGGYAFVFNFGSVVFFNVPQDVQREFLARIRPACNRCKDEIDSDDFLVAYHPEAREKVLFDRAVLHDLSETKLRIAALALGQSTALEHHERIVDNLVERSAHITDAMKRGGRVPGKEEDLVRFIGEALSTRREVRSTVAILDSPDIAWEDPDLDRLFGQLRANFELPMRLESIEEKLKLVVEGAEILVDLTKSRRTEVLELTIVVLIFVEILLAVLSFHH